MRGKKAQKAALRYIIFSLGGAFSILLGFAYAFSEMSHSLVFPISLLGAIEDNNKHCIYPDIDWLFSENSRYRITYMDWQCLQEG